MSVAEPEALSTLERLRLADFGGAGRATKPMKTSYNTAKICQKHQKQLKVTYYQTQTSYDTL